MAPLSTRVERMSTHGVKHSQQVLYFRAMNLGKRIEERLNELKWERSQLYDLVPELSPAALSALIKRDSKTLFMPAATFVREAKTAQRMKVSVPLYQNGELVFDFAIAGLEWPPKESSQTASR